MKDTSLIWGAPRYNDKPGLLLPNTYTKADIRAIQELDTYAQGLTTHAPSAENVKRVLDWIVYSASMRNELFFEPNAQDVMVFLAGRQMVGQSILKLLKIKPEALDGK